MFPDHQSGQRKNENKTVTAKDRPQETSSPDVLARSSANSGGTTVLETRNLSRAVMGKLLVDDMNLQVQHGEI
jgi:hypothetical protein